MDTFLASSAASLLAELGDKTQLLAIVMVVTFKRQWHILVACLFAIMANHFAAALIGQWLFQMIGPVALRWGTGMLFVGTMGWLLRPDSADDALMDVSTGVLFPTALLGFFVAEFGDKSQVVAATLAYSEEQTVLSVLGSTMGVLLATTPAVMFGEKLASVVSMRSLHCIAAGFFGLTGVVVLVVPSIFR